MKAISCQLSACSESAGKIARPACLRARLSMAARTFINLRSRDREGAVCGGFLTVPEVGK
jgi:hypothetical protein